MSWDVKFLPPAAGNSFPAWYNALTPGQWTKLTSVSSAPSLSSLSAGIVGQEVTEWCGAAASASTLLWCAQGGHPEPRNAAAEFLFNDANPRWVLNVAISGAQQADQSYYNDGHPTSRHGCDHDCYIPVLSGSSNGDRWYTPWTYAAYGAAQHYPVGASYSRANGTYDAQSTFPNLPAPYNGVFLDGVSYSGFVEFDSVSEWVWASFGRSGGFYGLIHLDPRTKVWTDHGTKSLGTDSIAASTCLIDTIRRVLVGTGAGDLIVYDLTRPDDTNGCKIHTVSGLPGGGIGFVYEPISKKWVAWNGGKTLQIITPPANYRVSSDNVSALNGSATYTIGQTISPSGGATPENPGGLSSQVTFGKFNYIANPPLLCVFSSYTEDMNVYPIPSTGIA